LKHNFVSMETLEFNIDKDTQWKDLIEELFPDFVAFFLPDIYPDINFNIPYLFLEQEFPKIVPEYFTEGKVINDKLVRVELKNGKEQLLLIHIEVQSQYDEDFANRMFTYYYRIVDRYHLPVEALAIFADKNKKFHPKVYQSKAYQTELIYKFRTYKVVLHTEAKLLKQKNNPFAFAVIAAKYLINTDKDLFDERKQYTLKLTRL